MELNRLISIEEKIEMGFIALAKLEASGLSTSFEYEETIKVINDCVREEKKLLASLSYEDILSVRKQILKYCNNKSVSLALGYLTNASYYRLLNIINSMLDSDSFLYAMYLRYDLNQIIFSFLDYLINNSTYEEIRDELILYKYNLIFMNHLSEEDFLVTHNISNINIESKSFKTDCNPDLIFVDKSILILEGREHVDTLEKYGDNLGENNNYFALVMISILELIARLVLSEEEILQYLQNDFQYLIEAESVSLDVKNLIQEMLNILERLKDRIEAVR